MTDRKHRNIKPGKGDISTFLDCPHRHQCKDIDDGWMLSECLAFGGTVSCEYNLITFICPRGYRGYAR